MDKFIAQVHENIQDHSLNHVTLQFIGDGVDNWQLTIYNAIHQTVPLSWFKRFPSPKHSDATKLLITLFTELQRHSKEHRWNLHSYRYYKNLQTILLGPYKRK